jgi:hypothetical protein
MAAGYFGKKQFWQHLAIGVFAAAATAPVAFARNVFLNGVDVSSSRSQELRNVQVRINEKGDIFISAPHYQVTEEDFFTPLSRVATPPQASQNSGSPELAVAPVSTLAPTSAAALSPSVPAAATPPAVAATATAKGSDKNSDKISDKNNDQGGGSFASSNIGAGKTGPESMPPVLEATPPSSGTPSAPKTP